MAKHSSDDDDDGGLDSLLDTMTNVVGILVIVLVVTQLGVSDAVQRISESEQVDPAAAGQGARRILKLVAVRREELAQQLEDLKPVNTEQHARRLQQMQERIERQRRLKQQAEQAANEFTAQDRPARKAGGRGRKETGQHDQGSREVAAGFGRPS